MKKLVCVLLVMGLALPLVATACPYHQAAGILNQLDGLLEHSGNWNFTRVGPDAGGLNHYQIQITADGGATKLFQGHNSATAIVNDVADFVEQNIDYPTYRG